MNAREPYSYVVLRYVHDVLTGEFVNVGLVMSVPGRPQFFAKARKTFGRIKNVFPDLDREAYKTAISAIERGMRKVERDLQREGLLKEGKSAEGYAHLVLPLDDSSLQWSPVGGGLSADPQRTFDQLYHRFVTQYDRSSQHRRSDDDVWRPVEAKLKEKGLSIDLEPKFIRGTTDAVEFRRAWKNGCWHAYEPLSFDLSDADHIKDKARRWLGHLSAVKNGATDDVRVHFIVGAPDSAALAPAYRNAVEILQQVPFDNRVFDENEIDDFVSEIEDEMRQH